MRIHLSNQFLKCYKFMDVFGNFNEKGLQIDLIKTISGIIILITLIIAYNKLSSFKSLF